MSHKKTNGSLAGSLLCVAAIYLGATAFAMADEDHGRRAAQVINNPLYQQECAACHTAYPPGMLPAASWGRIMRNLDQHFGRDASLEPEAVAALSQYLAQNAGTSRRVQTAPPEDRITRSDWFIREHREISPSTWLRAGIKTAANCAACHTTADKGNFDEGFVRIPKR